MNSIRMGHLYVRFFLHRMDRRDLEPRPWVYQDQPRLQANAYWPPGIEFRRLSRGATTECSQGWSERSERNPWYAHKIL
jgi:hypothetical protein